VAADSRPMNFTFDQMHVVFSRFIKLIKNSKSLYFKENPYMISREVFEAYLREISAKIKVVDGNKGIIVERRD
jgi:hypothetical protein